ncbi:Maf family protein [Acetobacteraceae bacterium H6797]|nr:Maf family protein [Acetobacteraceae bacterium H6797]
MIQRDDPAIILASGSASRRALMDAAGLRYRAETAHVDEASIKEGCIAEGIPAPEAAVILAEAKAERVARKNPEALVIGSDQLLVCGDRWFDKPVGMEGARGHLTALRGKTHQLVNGTVIWRRGQRIWQNVSTPKLTMRDFSDEFLEAYLAVEGEAVLASVGAYRMEGPGMHLFSKVEGEYAAILGLAMLPLLGFLRQHGVLVS